MDVGGDAAVILGNTEQNDSEPSNLNISDVFEAITLADPSFGAGVPSVEEAMAHAQPQPVQMPYVRVVQQPASKALRFRYECEGRSAGSIPGASSTPENRTFPAIKIFGYTGTVSIVVSCVTKDEPYRPHPHNLVGRDHCDRGVFSVRTEITDENNEYQFRNLGIQCVKRRDIGEALRIREELRVDPFRTGFTHRNHPQGIDLNAVRLAFQVFLPHSSGKMRRTLAPVVSDVIYDKKAMSDLLIMRASHCAGPARGGTQVILLCEKVTREDTVVVFYQEDNNRVLWEESAIIIVVHKQYAIAFETPPYKNPNITDNVHVRFQLRRVSDKLTSNSLPFEYIPEYQGTIRKPLPDLSFLSLLLNEKRTDTNNNKSDKQEAVSSTTDSVAVSESGADVADVTDVTDVNGNLDADADVDTNEKSLNELLEQVAELDEIYSENRTRLETLSGAPPEPDGDADDFNDAGTYTSLQLAFKNPVTITEPQPTSYEDVPVHTFRGPIIEFTPLKRDSDDDRAPPLPPKRVRKSTSTEPFKTSQTSVDSVLKPGRQLPVTRDRDVLKHENHLTVAKSEPALPPVKKRSFFSRLFRRKEKSPAPSVKSEGGKQQRTKPVGRSVSSVSGQRPSRFKSSVSHTSLKDNASGTGLSYADSVTHISLHGDDSRSASATSLRRSVGPAPPTDGSILVAESVLALDPCSFRRLQDELELTDAEHYALYMSVAPHATASEFDETSCYYSPVDGKPSYIGSKRRKTLIPTLLQSSYEQDRGFQQEQKPIKIEPRDKTPPHHSTSPLHVYPPYVDQQNWPMSMEQMQANLLMPGPSNPNAFQELQWGAQYQQTLATLQPPSPHHQLLSPNMQVVPNMGQSPMRRVVSPLAHSMHDASPMGQQMMGGTSPMGQSMHSCASPMAQPMQGCASPMAQSMQGGASPMAHSMQGAGSPNMVQHIDYSQMAQMAQMSQEGGTSFSAELARVEVSALSSGELLGLSALLNDRSSDLQLSSDLNRLSTSDMLL